MRALLREPLVHFLVAGALIFALYGGLAGSAPEPPDRIVVSAAQVDRLGELFERTWMRPPSDEELEKLVDDYVTEEVLYREALALGLDRDDVVVRRRMRQKMEFLNDGLAESEPDERELRDFLHSHADQFQAPARASFVQVFVNPKTAGSPVDRAAALLARLRAGEAADELGDPTLLPRALSTATPSEVAGSFGPSFAEALFELPVGSWSGPVESSFGLHLVRVSDHEPEALPPYEALREAVEREWRADARRRAREEFTAGLRERYDIEVRMPSPDRARGAVP